MRLLARVTPVLTHQPAGPLRAAASRGALPGGRSRHYVVPSPRRVVRTPAAERVEGGPPVDVVDPARPETAVPTAPAVTAARDPLWQRAETAFEDWRAGDRDGLDRLVRELTPVLWHVVRAYGIDRDAADDVVQATWLSLVRSADSIRDGRAVLRWLTTSARREAWRVSRVSRRDEATDDLVLDAALPSQASAEADVVRTDDDRRLWAAVATLSPRCQRLLRVVAFSERPDYAGLAEELGMPIGSIGPTRGRCLVKLRAELDTTGGTR